MEMSSASVTAQNLAARKFPMQLLCELAGAVMDANGELLQCQHLIKRPEYREVWGKAYGKELGTTSTRHARYRRWNRHVRLYPKR
ncbi:hypothetical protein ACHAXR_002949 [Thalassiosira sp. AJA248-18]